MDPINSLVGHHSIFILFLLEILPLKILTVLCHRGNYSSKQELRMKDQHLSFAIRKLWSMTSKDAVKSRSAAPTSFLFPQFTTYCIISQCYYSASRIPLSIRMLYSCKLSVYIKISFNFAAASVLCLHISQFTNYIVLLLHSAWRSGFLSGSNKYLIRKAGGI